MCGGDNATGIGFSAESCEIAKSRFKSPRVDQERFQRVYGASHWTSLAVWPEVPSTFVWKASGANRSRARKAGRRTQFHLVEDIVTGATGHL